MIASRLSGSARSLMLVVVLVGTFGAVGMQYDSARATGAVPPTSVQLFVQPGAGAGPVLSLIKQARVSIRLAVYLLTNRGIVGALSAAQKRGVQVRVMLEQHPFGGTRYARLGFDALQAAGVPVRWANEPSFTYTHEKTMEIDDRVAGIFTFNFTSGGLYRNREFGVIDANPVDARAIGAVFDSDWDRRSGTPRIGAPALVVSPTGSRRTLNTLLDQATRTLDVYAEEVQDASIELRLLAARRRGVRVRMLTSQKSAGIDALVRGGIQVKLVKHPYVHAKAIVADGAHLFLGSENISATSLDQNREMGILLTDSRLAGTVEHTFGVDWSGQSATPGRGTPAPPPTVPPPITGSLRVSLSLAPQSLHRGDDLAITAHTVAGAVCVVRLRYPNGFESHTRALRGPLTADRSGTVHWLSRIGSRSVGIGHVSVTCRVGNAAGTSVAAFQVQP